MWAELLSSRERDWSANRIALEGYNDAVLAIAFSPNGQFLASTSTDGSIRVWDVRTGICRSTMVGHTKQISSLRFSSDGSLLASTSRDKTIRLWNTGTWSLEATLIGHTETVLTLAWSHDDLFAATGSHDATVKLWDIGKELCYATLRGHTGSWVHNVAISPDDRLIASTSNDWTIRIWDRTTMLCCNVIGLKQFTIRAIHFSPDSRAIAAALSPFHGSGTRCTHVRSFHVTTGQNCGSFSTAPVSYFLAFSSSNENVTFLEDTTIRLYNYRTGLCHKELKGCNDFGTDMVISPDLTSIVTANTDGIIKIWDLAVPKSQNAYEDDVLSVEKPVLFLAASPDGKFLATRHHDEIRIWDSVTAACIHTFGSVMPVDQSFETQLGFSPNSLMLFYESKNGDNYEMRLWSMQTWSCCTSFSCSSWIEEIRFSEDGGLLVSQSADGTIRVWDVARGSCVSELSRDGHDVRHALFCLSRNNNVVAWISRLSMIHLWDIAAGSSKPLLDCPRSIENIAFSPNALLMATTCEGNIRLWDPETASCQFILEGHTESISELAFSANSKLLASICNGYSIRLWDTETGQCRYAFDDLVPWTYTVSFSSSGTCLETNAGSLAIPASLLDCPPLEIQRPPCIFVGERWIYFDGIPVFWLPSEYRPEQIETSGTTVLLATKEGKLLILRLDLDKLKRIYPGLLKSAHNQENTKFYTQSKKNYWLDWGY